jgi:aryl-alcohol dehydrogenase-like predicted oxidoreductase
MYNSNIGLGTSNLASFGRGLKIKEVITLFNFALENNVKVIDTSNTYGSGDSERLIAKGIEGRRKDYVLMTKAGFPYVHLPRYLSPLNQFGKKALQKFHVKKNFSKKYLINSLNASLKRLQTDYVDVFFLHEPLYNELIIHNDCWEAMYQIKKSGMAINIGISTNDTNAFNLAINEVELDVVQTSMPYFIQSTHQNIFNLCKEKNIQLVVNQVLRHFNYLKNCDNFLNLLKKYNQTQEDIIPILIAYSIYFMNSDFVLIGTKNINHLKKNIEEFNQKKNLFEIFTFINSIS